MPFIQFQFRRGLASEWASANTVLAQGEMGIETDTNLFKIGNGTTAWNVLAYGGFSGYSGISGWSGISGYSGSGISGYSGISGHSGISGYSGRSGWSGYSGYSGISGHSGISGYSGVSGYSGISGWSGVSGYSAPSFNPTITIDNKTSAYTVVSGDLNKVINCTSGTFTVALTAAATLGAGFQVTIWNTSNTDTHAITIDPNGSETIDGVATLILRRGEGMQIVCDGTNWQTGDKKVMRGYAENFSATQTRPIATGGGSIAIGVITQSTNEGSVAIGGNSIQGSGARATGIAAIAIGARASGTLASGTHSIAIGSSDTQDPQATSYSAVAIGANSGGAGSQAVSGAGAMALGGSYASGADSFAAAVVNNTNSYGATGANSVAIGKQARATGPNSVAIGVNALANPLTGNAYVGTAIGTTSSETGGGAAAISND